MTMDAQKASYKIPTAVRHYGLLASPSAKTVPSLSLSATTEYWFFTLP